MERRAKQYMLKNDMLKKGDRIVAGISGGADSMCLLCLLSTWREEYGLTLYVVHVNHGIRGENARHDEEFVEDFCKKNSIEFTCIHADVPKLAAETGCTEEEAGRNLRYEAFLEVCEQYDCTKIAVAHNRDDNTETVLFNLFRGSGISGIRGIAPVRRVGEGVSIIRPLLDTSRADIEKYLKKLGQTYCTDETNAETEYSRNRLRNIVIPYIRKEINSEASRHVAELASQAAEMEGFVEDMTTEYMAEMERRDELIYHDIAGALTEIQVDADRLSNMNSVLRKSIERRLIGRLAGKLKDIEGVHVDLLEALLKKGVGKSIDLPYSMVASRGYKSLILKKRKLKELKEVSRIYCDIPGSYELPGLNMILSLRVFEYKNNMAIPKNMCTKWFDYDKIRNNIVIRTRQSGDFFCIRKQSDDASAGNVTGRKSLKSYFIDNKITRDKRDSKLLLAEGEHILWIIGERGDDAYPVTKDTVRVLEAILITKG